MREQMRLQNSQKIEKVLKRIEIELKKFLGEKLKKVILFGSYSRGDYDSDSDIDLIALVDEPQPDEKYEDQIVDIVVDLSIEFDVVLSLFLENEREYEKESVYTPFLQNIHKEGIEIYAV